MSILPVTVVVAVRVEGGGRGGRYITPSASIVEPVSSRKKFRAPSSGRSASISGLAVVVQTPSNANELQVTVPLLGRNTLALAVDALSSISKMNDAVIVKRTDRCGGTAVQIEPPVVRGVARSTSERRLA